MKKSTRALLLASTAFGVMLAGTANAADNTAEMMKALQKQVNELQKQLNTLQTQSKEQAKTESSSPAAKTADGVQKEILPGVKVTLGGFVAMDGIFRDKNQTTDSTSSLNTGIPFDNATNAHQSEFRGSARASRLSLLAEGQVDKDTKLAAYFETDFLGAGPTSNSVATNSYLPRLRQAFATVDREDWGFHFLAGQAYSLATMNRSGIVARKENLPMVIDSALVPGTTYTRNPQIRFVKDFDSKKVQLGLSFESPEANVGGLTCTARAAGTCATFPIVNATNAGVSPLNSGAQYSTDYMPDIIAKVAFDPGYGHYELFGIARLFHDNVDYTHNNTVWGGGGGGAAILPLIEKKLEVQANVAIGKGIGRYSPVGFPDFAFKPDGSMEPLMQYTAMMGVVARPDPTWDLYAYLGGEMVDRQEEAGSIYGYGDRTRDNSTCGTPGAACTAQTKSVWMITPGFWKQVYKGDYGNMKVGAQYSYVRRDAFSDAAGNDPHAATNIVMTSFRYSPF